MFPWQTESNKMDTQIGTSTEETASSNETVDCEDKERNIDENAGKDCAVKEDIIPEENVEKESKPESTKTETTVYDSTKIDSETEVKFLPNEMNGESLEAIKKLIAVQEKEILQLQSEVKPSNSVKIDDHVSYSAVIASDVMDIILSSTESKLMKSPIVKKSPKKIANIDKVPSSGSSNMSLAVGSKVEAKDYDESWHPAQILEVDYDEMEVLVHYENESKRHDEWINVSSPRLRPLDSGIKEKEKELPPPITVEDVIEPRIKEEKERQKIGFKVGDRCFARWRDNRRFMATVFAELDNGKYEIVFDDGFHWTCDISRLYKRETDDPSPAALPPPIAPLYSTHLFDPSRDYLGSKSERREKKRKLNIKEIFNIGQKKITKKRTDRVKKVKEEKMEIMASKEEMLEIEVPPLVDYKEEREQQLQQHEQKFEQEEETLIIEEVKPDVEYDECDPTEFGEELKIEMEKIEGIVIKCDPNQDVDMDNEHSNPESPKEPDTQEEEEKEIDEAPNDNKPEIQQESTDVSGSNDTTPTPTMPIKKKKPKIKINDFLLNKEINKKKKMKQHINKMRTKKIKMLREKRVNEEVERVKSELEEMKRQVEEMKKQVWSRQMEESLLLPGEWCCKWTNGQPVGEVSEMEVDSKDPNKPMLPRRSVKVEDKRLPPGWTKHMVRRSFGSSAGKWDVVLISPDNKRFHTKTDMRNYLESLNEPSLKPFEAVLYDFGVHRKLSKRMGWDIVTAEAEPAPVIQVPPHEMNSTSPLVKVKKLKLNLKRKMEQKPKKTFKKKKRKIQEDEFSSDFFANEFPAPVVMDEPVFDASTLEDGFVHVGSLKVQIIDGLLRCPADGCFKNFRNNTLLKMHIKHYHRELRKLMGATPKVSDLAEARTLAPTLEELKIKRPVALTPGHVPQPTSTPYNQFSTDVEMDLPREVRPQDSPKLRGALSHKPVKRPKVLLPVRRLDEFIEEHKEDFEVKYEEPKQMSIPDSDVLDFESAISTHTVTKPASLFDNKKKPKKRKTLSSHKTSEDEWASDFDTRSSFPRSGSPDKLDKFVDTPPPVPMSSESNEGPQDAYTLTDTGEKVKIVHMKREEIINCHCGLREEDGLMIQCELCLCWQHALCHNIQKVAEVPEKYTCSICLFPRRGRRSLRFVHDQDRLLEGVLPGAKANEPLRRAHELSGNLTRVQYALHALKIKYYVATKKDHPKLYLWATDWEASDHNLSQDNVNQDNVNQDYVDLSAMISEIGKENLPMKTDDVRDISLSDIRTPPSEEQDVNKDVSVGSHGLLSGLLSSPGGASLDLPISTSELERLAKSVQESESQMLPVIPQPEAAIENSVCRERLLKHIQRCQALLDARLDSIEAQVAELESQDPSFEDDETADYFPRTKQTIQMLLRDLDTMEELGVIT